MPTLVLPCLLKKTAARYDTAGAAGGDRDVTRTDCSVYGRGLWLVQPGEQQARASTRRRAGEPRVVPSEGPGWTARGFLGR
jgi:hypothetical protein